MLLRHRRVITCLALTITLAAPAAADDVDLGSTGASHVWLGAAPGAGTGFQLHRAFAGNDDTLADLVVAAPGAGSDPGKVYLFFGRPPRPGSASITTANVAYTGTAGDRFGSSLASGNVLNAVGAVDLVIGAPSASSGRGIVYLFAGPPASGTMTAASATLRVIGTPGDQLGKSIATADLNGDGYREIIIGAPGNGRVYIVNGGPSLSGTLDLTVQLPSAALFAQAIGSEIATGDVTGDGIYDLVIGAPQGAGTAGRIYIVRGRALSGPLDLEAIANTVLDGFEVGDAMGTSIRVADINGAGAGGVRDLVVTAPGGDGPSNSRPNAGEAYVIFGGSTFPTGRLSIGAGANVVFFGGAPGDRFGARVDSGDINRDVADDLIFVSSGANGGAGDVRVFYGRLKSQFGLSVDMANSYNRRLWAAQADGPISAAIAYEMTGEGANDVIVGVSSANVAAGAGGGKAILALSPKLTLSQNSLSISAPNSRSQAIEVRNFGTGAMTWAVSTTTPWISLSSTTGTSSATASSSFVVTVARGSLPVGVHTGTITIRSTTFDLFYQTTFTVSLVIRTPDGDIDGDRQADVGIFRPSTGGWYAINSASGTGFAYTWGGAGDIPVASDYDGDGRIDIGIFRPSASMWYIVFSGTNTGLAFGWGGTGDIPVPGDYDGDAKTDIAVFRPSNGTWYVLASRTHTMVTYSWGSGTDKPVPGDYDGDGKTDVAVFRPSTGTWHIRQSSDLAGVAIPFGAPSDVPVAGDYNGDGITDIAVFRRSTGNWYVRGIASLVWGGGDDIPVPGDFDGDTLTDIAVFRPSTGTWYIRLAIGVARQTTWGAAGDIPILKR